MWPRLPVLFSGSSPEPESVPATTTKRRHKRARPATLQKEQSPWQPINPPPAPPTGRSPRNDRNFLSVPASRAQLEPLNRGGVGGNVPKFDEKSQKPYKRDKPLLEPPGRSLQKKIIKRTPPPFCVFQKRGPLASGLTEGDFPIHSFTV
jgi:hypothetical protein